MKNSLSCPYCGCMVKSSPLFAWQEGAYVKPLTSDSLVDQSTLLLAGAPPGYASASGLPHLNAVEGMLGGSAAVRVALPARPPARRGVGFVGS